MQPESLRVRHLVTNGPLLPAVVEVGGHAALALCSAGWGAVAVRVDQVGDARVAGSAMVESGAAPAELVREGTGQ